MTMAENPPFPPKELEAPLELDPEAWDPKQVYYLQTALVIPRPIAWVSTLSSEGAENLAPHSYFNGICDDPPYIMFSIEGDKDTYHNVRETNEFVVNFVTLELAQKMELTAVDFPAEENEFEWAKLHTVPARRVRPPRVAEAKACLECRLDRIIDIGKRNHVVIGEVVHFFVKPSIWHDGRVDPKLYQPLCRLGVRYGELGTIFRMDRPKWEEVKEETQDAALALIRKQTL
jgi:flavin reductase (DIM6/NTAB) family NADH-FMN oxidoreductase RutF